MRALLVLTLALSTAGCTAAVVPSPAPDSQVPVAATPAPRPTPRPSELSPAPVPVPRPSRPEVEPFDLAQLGGATESAVVVMIGHPDAVRERPPGKVWVYNQGACQVEVYMYPSVDVGSMAVLGTSLAPDTLQPSDRDRCRRGLARRTAKAQ